MTLREQIEALRRAEYTRWPEPLSYSEGWDDAVCAVLDIIERWVNDELPKIIESAVDEALDNLKQDAIWAEERDDSV